MADTKPRWGWYMNKPKSPEIEDWDAVLALVDALNPGWLPQLKYGTNEIEAAVDTYFWRKLDNYPSSAEVRAAARILKKELSGLRETLEKTDDVTRLRLEQRVFLGDSKIEEMVADPADGEELTLPEQGPSQFELLVSKLAEFEIAAETLETSSSSAPSKRPNRREALDELIGWFGGFYYQATGHPPQEKITYDKETKEYWSPFITFLTDVLNLIDKDHGYTNNTIGDAVRRAIGNR
jgi:hypothetical protein